MRGLFLCTELAGYFSNCIRQLKIETDASLLVIQWPNSSEAPFVHNLEGITLVDRSELSSSKLLETCIEFNPDIVYVSGWVDADYKRVARVMKRKGRIVICGLDNVWKGTIRQRAASFLSPILIEPYYTHVWVAGHRQYHFAKRLGFTYGNILTGLYSADIDNFKPTPNILKEHYIVYVGRFEPIKGIDMLYRVFSSLTNEERNGWRLKMIGNGSLKNTVISTESIDVHNFMQPQELSAFVSNAGGFILPSIEEPWGVVVQEFAAAGMPLLLSDSVNSGEEFLIHNYNGFKFKNRDELELRKTLIAFFKTSEARRKEMGRRSVELAMKGNPRYWVASICSLYNENISTL